MTQIEFAKILNEMIESIPNTKNETIGRTGIDRSTFFKFLSGKRFPTADQLATIIEKSGIKESDVKKLRKAYDETHYSHILYNNIEVVRQCLEAMTEASYLKKYERSNDTDIFPLDQAESETGAKAEEVITTIRHEIQGRSDIEYAIVTLINGEISRGRVETYCFLPLNATKFLIKNRNIVQHCNNKVHFLFRFSDTLDELSKHTAPQFYDLIPMALAVDCQIRFFYGGSDLADGTGLLFPYYIISGSGVLFLNSQLTEGVYTQDKTLIDVYQRAYKRAFLMSDEITNRIESLDDVRSVIVNQISLMHASDHLLMINHSPCMNMIATEELVRKFIDPSIQDKMWAYSSMLQNSSPIEIVSPEGIREMAATYRLEEYNFRMSTTKEIAHNALLGLRARLGKTLFIADSNHLVIPEEWSVFAVPERSIILIPQYEKSTAVSLYEKNILHSFSVAFDTGLEYFVLTTQMAERILDYYIEETAE